MRSFGTLRAVMREGRTQASVRLDELLPDPQLYALGALEGLQGEVTVLGGEAILSWLDPGGELRTTRSTASERGAALLVAARVPAWKSVELAGPIRFEELGERVRAAAESHGLDPARAFVFQIEGEVRDLRAHVVDGRALGDGPSTHEAHARAGYPVTRPLSHPVLLGFHSERDQGVFTHHGEHLHLHAVLEGLTAHVDELWLPGPVRLFLPG